MKNKTSTPIYLIVLAFLASVLLTACGGGGSAAPSGGGSWCDRYHWPLSNECITH